MSLVRTLVHEYKADVNARDDNNDTPLHVAIMEKKEEVDDAICMEHRLCMLMSGYRGLTQSYPTDYQEFTELITQSLLIVYTDVVYTFLFS